MDYICPTCHGDGEIADFDDLNDIDTIRFVQCPTCGGSGFIKESN